MKQLKLMLPINNVATHSNNLPIRIGGFLPAVYDDELTSLGQVTTLISEGGGGASINYSPLAQDTGIKWIDGDPVYQITFDSLTENFTIPDFKTPIEINAVARRNISNQIIFMGVQQSMMDGEDMNLMTNIDWSWNDAPPTITSFTVTRDIDSEVRNISEQDFQNYQTSLIFTGNTAFPTTFTYAWDFTDGYGNNYVGAFTTSLISQFGYFNEEVLNVEVMGNWEPSYVGIQENGEVSFEDKNSGYVSATVKYTKI
tara:strand:- start:307 stop:1074 length:768 start_codon:yes stop_codon:yes gene_type:complete